MNEAEKNKIKYKIMDSKMISVGGRRYIQFEDIMKIIKDTYEDSFNVIAKETPKSNK